MTAEPESTTAKDLSRSQFGTNAANYATSVVHAKGASLETMVVAAFLHPQGTTIENAEFTLTEGLIAATRPA